MVDAPEPPLPARSWARVGAAMRVLLDTPECEVYQEPGRYPICNYSILDANGNLVHGSIGPLGSAFGAVTPREPQALWERLAARDFVPLDWVEDARRAFDHGACAACEGRGTVGLWRNGRCDACVGTGRVWRAHPPTIGACLAIVADLDGFALAETLAWQVSFKGPVMPARVAWRFERGDELAATRERWRALVRYTEERAPEFPEIEATGYVLDAITDAGIVLVCPEF